MVGLVCRCSGAGALMAAVKSSLRAGSVDGDLCVLWSCVYGCVGVRGEQGMQEGPDERFLKTSACCKHAYAYSVENLYNGTNRHSFDAIVSQQVGLMSPPPIIPFHPLTCATCVMAREAYRYPVVLTSVCCCRTWQTRTCRRSRRA